jgi:ligand-binding sensor domain-containing protein
MNSVGVSGSSPFGLAFPGLRLATTLPALLLVCCSCAFSLDPSLDVSQYAHTVWRVREGFGKGAINSMAQTPDGYLWLGTELGLLRFDGVHAAPWQPPIGQQLPASLITTLLATHDGTLWIGTMKGLSSWKNGEFREVPPLHGSSVTSLLEDRNGVVWVGIFAESGGGLCDIVNGLVHCNRDGKRFATGVMAMYEDRNGTLWLGTSKGIWRWNPVSPRFFSVPVGPSGITSFAEDEHGQLLFGSLTGIRRFIEGKAEPYPSASPGYAWEVTRMFCDHEGGLWVGTVHGLIHIRGQQRIEVFSHSDDLSGDYVTRFLEDREGNIWVSTWDGIDRFRDYAVPTISTPQGLSSTTTWSVLASNDNSVWIGTSSGLNHWKNGQISAFDNRKGTPKAGGNLNGQPPTVLLQDRNGRIWASTVPGGVGYLDDDRFIPIPGLPSGTVLSMAESPSGHQWSLTRMLGSFICSRDTYSNRYPGQTSDIKTLRES